MSEAEDTKYCSNCKRDIASGNYVMHEVHCRRNIVLCEKCQEPVAKSELEAHFDEYHKLEKCSLCNQQFEVSKLQDHQAEECPKRKGKCEYCELDLAMDGLEEHKLYCGTRTEHCTSCNQFIMIKDLDQHMVSGCTYPTPKPRNVDLSPGAAQGAQFDDVLLPDEMYAPDNFAMAEMSRMLNTDLRFAARPNENLIADNMGLGRNRRPENRGARSQAANNTAANNTRQRVKPRQPMSHRQSNQTQDRNYRKPLNVERRQANQRPPAGSIPPVPPPSNWDTDLDALLARHLAEDLAEPSPSGPANNSDDDEFMIPCEFCHQIFPSENLIQHQSLCAAGTAVAHLPSSWSADDIVSMSSPAVRPARPAARPSRAVDDAVLAASPLNNRRKPRHQPSPPPHNFIDNLSHAAYEPIESSDELMLPCEFCDDLFPADFIVQHQVVCDANGTESPASHSPARAANSGPSTSVKHTNSTDHITPARAGYNPSLASQTRNTTKPTGQAKRTTEYIRTSSTTNGSSNYSAQGSQDLRKPTPSFYGRERDSKAVQNLQRRPANFSGAERASGTQSESRVRRRQAADSSFTQRSDARTAPKLTASTRANGLQVTGSRTDAPRPQGPTTSQPRTTRTKTTQPPRPR